MYIRQISRRRSDGSRVRYLQLAHKVRDPDTGRPKDQVLFHLGREDKIDKAQIKRLVLSLSRFLGADERTAIQAHLDGVAGADVSVEKTLSMGGSYVLDALWRRLELDNTLKELLSERSFEIEIERLLFALVANRALAPRSKLGMERWVGRKAHIEGLDGVQSHALYRAMDFLLEHGEAIQQSVFFSVATLLNLEVDLLFFDTTSSYFEIEDADEEDGLRQYGHSKDHRKDLPQVVIGLAVTRSGIPVRCWVWPGNKADASTVEEVQKDLAGWKLSRVVWVVDRGFAGEKQRHAFQRGGGHVIVGEKLRGAEQLNHEALKRPGRFKTVRDNLEVKEVTVGEGSAKRRFVVVRNPAQAVRDEAVRARLLARLEDAIEHVNRTKRGHTKAVCELKSHRGYGRYIRELKNSELRIDRAKVKADAKLDGKYLISTTDPTLSAEDVALGYKQLLEVERAFRTMKNTLELRPLHHRLPERIRAHVLLCWLGLLLVRVAENESGMTWDCIRDSIEEISLVKLCGKDGRVELVSELVDEQHNILKKLSVKQPKRVQKLSQTT
jgi:transposase